MLYIDISKAGKAHLPEGAERFTYKVPSEYGVIYIPVNRLKQVYQTDKATDWDKVHSLMKKMKEGREIDPVEIGYSYDVHDGHHRWIAARELNYTHVPCKVVGTDPEKVREAKEEYRKVWKSDDMSLIVDLLKAHILHKEKLVKRPVQVKGNDGRVFTRMQWVDPNDHSKVFDSGTDTEPHKQVFNKKPFQPPKPLHELNHGLDEHELSKRQGKVGSIHHDKLNQGTPLTEAFSRSLKRSKEILRQHPTTAKDADNIDIEGHVKNIFGDMTKEGLEHVFSNPDKGYTANMTNLSVWGNSAHGHIEVNIEFEWRNQKGSIGQTSRSVYRDEQGLLHVFNDMTEMYAGAVMGKGIGQDETERSEQLWRHLSGGHPFHMTLQANISIGVYAWALRGYDFGDSEDIWMAQDKLKKFTNRNNIDLDSALKHSGYNSIDDLQHSWQFATLTDGNSYNLVDYGAGSSDTKRGAAGHLGKTFMLGGMESWLGEKIMNGNTDHEMIGELHKSSKRRKGY